jgi:hypothetical protein
VTGGLTFSVISALIEPSYGVCARDTYFSNAALAREPSAFGEVCLKFLEGNALLMSARLGHEDIPKIFPERPVLSQVNLHGDFAPFCVGYKLNSGHGFIPFAMRSRITVPPPVPSVKPPSIVPQGGIDRPAPPG